MCVYLRVLRHYLRHLLDLYFSVLTHFILIFYNLLFFIVIMTYYFNYSLYFNVTKKKADVILNETLYQEYSCPHYLCGYQY